MKNYFYTHPMKKILPAFALLMATIISSGQKPLNVLTFNIRFDNPKDAPNDWPNRKEKVTSQILFHEADIIGIQEALHAQLLDMEKGLPGYKYTGVARDDGKQKGEYSCIFYNTNRLELLASETFWLSETPTVAGSKSWDAAITRVVTWAKFKDRKTKKVFYHFNTHFDHMGQVARRESAKLLLKAVDSIAGKTPAVITGDFNAKPQDEPIRVIVDESNPLKLIDSKAVSAAAHFGPNGTFNAFQAREQADQPIDYIFLKGNWKVAQHATLSQTWGGLFSSDHFPVFARLMLGK
jgi:endonuclease/exonuclease/phosphatase family metal-dependent hydrolase